MSWVRIDVTVVYSECRFSGPSKAVLTSLHMRLPRWEAAENLYVGRHVIVEIEKCASPTMCHEMRIGLRTLSGEAHLSYRVISSLCRRVHSAADPPGLTVHCTLKRMLSLVPVSVRRCASICHPYASQLENVSKERLKLDTQLVLFSLAVCSQVHKTVGGIVQNSLGDCNHATAPAKDGRECIRQDLPTFGRLHVFSTPSPSTEPQRHDQCRIEGGQAGLL